MSTLYESFESGENDSTFQSSSSHWEAQSFTPSISHEITSVQLYLVRWQYNDFGPGTVTVSIKATDPGNGKPTGADLCASTVDGLSLPKEPAYEWVTFTFATGAELTAGTKYAIVIRAALDQGYNVVFWRMNTSGGYADGTRARSDNSGDSWTIIDDDLYFREYGNPVLPEKPINPTPSDTDTGVDFSGLVLDWDDGGGADTFDVYMGPVGALAKVADAIVPSTYTVDLEDVPTDQVIYWRVDATNAAGTTTGDVWNFDARPVKATTPSPTDAVSDITLDETPLSWVDGGNADTYNVYFGESGSEALVASLQADVEWTIDFGTLDYDTTYGWRIDSVNDFGTTTGDTWTFDTIAFSPMLISYELIGDGPGPYDDPPGIEGTNFVFTGENNMITVKRLVAAANSKIWYESL